ncbi:potassium-transporting ATPase subunit KdpC [Kitasatospora sp. GAS204B]|uniref:potassium-transporting ATPase subunit KdpC n=1 Tax=unclassified Kitasatospora TaxID=2633591 RepID=UPI002475B70C|nr:potassium-transporting ATPase subunit KdpC [Kitasatospora sp. GAS204B]MDH6117733.1 K+-transporting ATPase ATPase C chain [Kitasatospora sp. GAS204B]
MANPLATLAKLHLTGLRVLLVFTVLCGIAYPLVIVGLSQALLPGQANGSLVRQNGQAVGSGLIGQNFTLPASGPSAAPQPDPKWFQPRPSAAGSSGYDASASGGSNLGPNDPGLLKSVQQRRSAVAAFDGVDPAQVPPDAVTASGSGLDPAISPTYAYQQVDRVAKARGLDPQRVHQLVADHVEGRVLGFLGQQRVDVVTLNLALARLG